MPGYAAVRGFQNNANQHTKNNMQNSAQNNRQNQQQGYPSQETDIEKKTRILNSPNPMERVSIYTDEANKELVKSIMKNISTKNKSDYPPNGPKSHEDKRIQEDKLKLILNTFIELPDIQNTDIQNNPILNKNSLFIESLRNSINSRILMATRDLPSYSNSDYTKNFYMLISKIVIKAILDKDNDPSTPNFPYYLASVSQQSIASNISGFFSWGKKTAGKKGKKKNGTKKKRKNNSMRKRRIR